MQKTSVDIYTAMLGLSLLAIIVAIIFMLLEMAAYNWDYKAQAARGLGWLRPPAAIERMAASDAPLPELRLPRGYHA